MSHIVGRGAPNPYFEKIHPLYWVLPPLLKGFSFLKCFLADKQGIPQLLLVMSWGHSLTEWNDWEVVKQEESLLSAKKKKKLCHQAYIFLDTNNQLIVSRGQKNELEIAKTVAWI